MKISSFFNYKDWTSYVSWIIIIFVISEHIHYWDTLIRWKWGYWSIDLIPSIIVLVLWFLCLETVRLNRLGHRVRELEEEKEE